MAAMLSHLPFCSLYRVGLASGRCYPSMSTREQPSTSRSLVLYPRSRTRRFRRFALETGEEEKQSGVGAAVEEKSSELVDLAYCHLFSPVNHILFTSYFYLICFK